MICSMSFRYLSRIFWIVFSSFSSIPSFPMPESLLLTLFEMAVVPKRDDSIIIDFGPELYPDL